MGVRALFVGKTSVIVRTCRSKRTALYVGIVPSRCLGLESTRTAKFGFPMEDRTNLLTQTSRRSCDCTNCGWRWKSEKCGVRGLHFRRPNGKSVPHTRPLCKVQRRSALRPHSPNTTFSCSPQLIVTKSVISRMVMRGISRLKTIRRRTSGAR